jgi:hypothetical protein
MQVEQQGQQGEQAEQQIDLSLITDKGLNPPLNDKKAYLEFEDFANHNKRNNKLRDNFHQVMVIALWATFAGFVILAIARIFLLVLPDANVWLSPDRIAQIDSIFTHTITGGLGLYAGKYLQERL